MRYRMILASSQSNCSICYSHDLSPRRISVHNEIHSKVHISYIEPGRGYIILLKFNAQISVIDPQFFPHSISGMNRGRGGWNVAPGFPMAKYERSKLGWDSQHAVSEAVKSTFNDCFLHGMIPLCLS